MAVRKSVKTAKRPVRRARKTGSRSWTLIVLVAAAALAAVLYAVMSPSGIFKPGPVAAPATAGNKAEGVKATASAKAVKAEPKKAEIKSEPKAEPKPVAKAEPKPVPAPVPVAPPAPACNGQPLSLSDVQGKVGNPSYIFVDVRPAARFAAANIPGSRNIPADDFDAAFGREGAGLVQSAGVILYGEEFNDPAVVAVCTKMSGKNLPRIYLFREGWSRWVQTPAQ